MLSPARLNRFHKSLLASATVLFFLLCYAGFDQLAGSSAAPATAAVTSTARHATAAMLTQQLYIWQRRWTAEHAGALAQSQADFQALRVLGLQYHRSASGPVWVLPQPDLALLAHDGRPVWLVVRLDGQLAQLPFSLLGQKLQLLLQQWQHAGIQLAGIELDYDSASSQLALYQQWLQQLRPLLPSGMPLGITALPDWLTSSDFAALLQTTDQVTLQLHSVLDPSQGLFQLELAKGWIRQLLRWQPKQFSLALPAYHSALIRQPNGMNQPEATAQQVWVESEVPLAHPGQRQELYLDPKPLQQLLQWLAAEQAKAQLPGLVSLVWFRLPLPGDQRAWPYAVLQAVVRQQPLAAKPVLQLRGQAPQLQLVLHNQGNIALDLPAQLQLQGRECLAADALQGYQLTTTQAAAPWQHYQLRQPASNTAPRRQLAPGVSLILGWWHCQQLHLTEGHTDETAAH